MTTGSRQSWDYSCISSSAVDSLAIDLYNTITRRLTLAIQRTEQCILTAKKCLFHSFLEVKTSLLRAAVFKEERFLSLLK